jgi:hypothetical protein
MGGGSYACVKTPPFCKEPLIPKDNRLPPYIPEPSPAFPTVPTDEQIYNTLNDAFVEMKEQGTGYQSAMQQGELF